MVTIVNALVPVFLLIALGLVVRRAEFVPTAFWNGVEKLNYWILLPALFFHALGTARLGSVPWPRVAAVAVLGLLLTALLVRLAWPLFGGDGPAFTSVLQGAIRFNSFVGLAVLFQLFGAEGLTLCSVIVAVSVPLVNVLCVLALARHGRSEPGATPSVLRAIGTNPLILSCLAGALWSATGLGLGSALETTFKAMGQAAIVLGLMVVGAALEFTETRAQVVPTLIASAGKFAVLPLLTAGLCHLLEIRGTPAQVLVFFQTLPTATSSYILARQLGGDAKLMSTIVTFQTVAALVALPVVLAINR
ncbi:MAG: AEC family transporter [Verrucomicrobia bacterium]|nr:AEC family transporter [Verrucomicrobiota bacterium]